MSAPTASDSPTSFASAAEPIRNANTASRKNSRGSQSSTRSIDPLSHFDTASAAATKAIAFPTSVERVGRTTAAARHDAEHEPDDEILRDEDREHEVGLVVRQAAEVDQALDGDRARRDVDRRGEDDRRRS